MRHTPDSIQTLAENEVFVFGSNLAGIHGAGAALLAMRKFGAVLGVGIGHEGQTYALPTKDKALLTLSMQEIAKHVRDFLAYAEIRKDLTFLVTQIGCGLAGYSPRQIAPIFILQPIPSNVVLPEIFWKEIQS